MIESAAIVPLAGIAPRSVEALLDRAFGPERHARTAYRLRAGAEAIATLSFGAIDASGTLLGSVQAWPVGLWCDAGSMLPMVMVGPIAVEPVLQRDGLGQRLTRHLIDAADSGGVVGADTLMLIGDPEYYARFFGFSSDRTSRWRLPGPFEPRRLLARGSEVPDRAGTVGPRVPTAA